MDESRLDAFVTFARGLKGDEKSEAQTFLTHLFQAPGENIFMIKLSYRFEL